MEYRALNRDSQHQLADLFRATFTAAEGEQEGELVGALASSLAARVDNRQVIAVGACEGESIIGAAFFTPLTCSSGVSIQMLAPVAVGSAHQRRGTGQELIRYGLDLLRERAVAVVVTYGDPGYYCKTGFQPISTTTIQPPLPLSMPHGWLGQSLTGNPLPVIGEQTRCVSEFNDPVYW